VSEPKPPADAQGAYARLVTYADRIFLAVEELEQYGGMKAVGSGWTAAKLGKAAAVLRSARDALEVPLREIKELSRRPPARRPRRPTDPSE
jgi:hypothetical protein